MRADLFALILAFVLPALAHAQIERLDSIDPMSVPAGPEFGRELERNFWQFSDEGAIRAALTGLGNRPLSGVWREAAIDLVAAGAASPVRGTEAQMSLAALRIETLEKLGRPDLALELFTRTPGLDQNEATAELGAQLLLGAGDINSACDRDDRLSEQSVAPFWVQLRIACLALAGEAAAADVTLRLAQDQGISGIDSTFAGYIGALKNEGAVLPAIQPRTVLETAIASRRTSSPTIRPAASLIAGINDPSLDPTRRVEIARDALAAGLIGIARFSDIIERLSDTQRPANASAPIPDVIGATRIVSIPATALARHEVLANPDASMDRKAAVFEALYRSAKSPREKIALAVHYRRLLDTLPMQTGGNAALSLAEAAALTGDGRLAALWLDAYEAVSAGPVTLTPSGAMTTASPFGSSIPSGAPRKVLPEGFRASVMSLARVAASSGDVEALDALATAKLREHGGATSAERERIGKDLAVIMALGAAPQPQMRRIAPVATGPSADLFWAMAAGARGESLAFAYRDAGLGFAHSIYAIDAMRAAGLRRLTSEAALELMLTYR